MITKDKFTSFRFSTPLLETAHIKYYRHENCNLFLTSNELSRFDEVMSKKGNCSTNEAALKIAHGDVFNSHALPFYLYNFSALQVINVFIENKKDCSVLELGCNNGHVSRLLQRNQFKFKEYWGVDFDFSFIVDGISSFTENDDLFINNFCSGNFNKPLNFKDNYFGLVYFQEAFDHCRDKLFYAEQCLSELKRVLKPGGYLYISLVFDHENRDLYHWDHNYVWKKFEFENMIQDYFEIANFVPLLTFEQTLNNTVNQKIADAYRNWPKKFAKMICAHFVDPKETAVGAYLLRKGRT
jgi:SAM-dependent methyltransferase